jgi:hypothetical protein
MKTLMICLFRGLRIGVFPDHLEMEGRAHELTREDVEKLVALLVRVALLAGGPGRGPRVGAARSR